MRIAVLNNWVPFTTGGAEFLADWLTAKLLEYGHQATLVRLPFTWDPLSRIVENMLAARLTRLPGADRVVALKFPAYYVPHDDKVLWLLHQFRQVYDFWGTRFQGLPNNAEGFAIRDAVTRADNTHLRQVRKIYTNSQVTSDRLSQFNGIESEVLYPPLFDVRGLECEAYGDYVFAPGRVNESKRQHLLVESMRYTRSGVRLVVAGMPESTDDLARISGFIAGHGLEKKVELIPRFISEEEKRGFYRRALACAYIPYDEDSYGYVTMEAFECRKPVLTCSDSGGIHILVKDGQTGFSVPPEPQALAAAMDRFFEDAAATRRMGESGYALMRSLRIDWDHVIERLTR